MAGTEHWCRRYINVCDYVHFHVLHILIRLKNYMYDFILVPDDTVHLIHTVRGWRSMYTAVAQSVLLYGSEIWLVTRDILKVLMAFHHWAARRITGMTEK